MQAAGRPRVRGWAASLAAALALAPALGRAQSAVTGDQVFAARCVRCHGDHGQGSEKNPKPLVGDLSVDQLAGVIADTMPEDDPGTLSPDEAQAVAAYIHDAFYSPIARARNMPARIDLARFTVRQYRQTVADLIDSFAAPARWADVRGLRGEYFDSRDPGNVKDRRERRIDPDVNFDFGTGAPVAGIEQPRRYSIRWTGSFYAPETGDYEFVVRTEHAARLWINDNKTALVDAWVKSGTDSEYTATLFLVGGRVYPLRMDFTKAKQGVDDSDKQKGKKAPPSAPASIALLWKRPQGVVELIPTRFLSPDSAPETFVSATPFPPDDRSLGWERGAAVSQQWDDATTSAAIEALSYITDRLDRLAKTDDRAKDRAEKLRAFCTTFAERAFRRPLDDELKQKYIDRQFDAAGDDLDAAVRRVVLLVLKSPRFLFREVDGRGDDYDIASRLSFALWNSIPDQQLLKAAKSGRLHDLVELRKQVERMLADYRAQAKLQDFLLTWLHLDAGADLTKDAKAFPDFDASAIADVRTSLELSLTDVLSSPEADFRRLLLDDEVYVNDRLAKIYGVAPTQDDSSEQNASAETTDDASDDTRDDATYGESKQLEILAAANEVARIELARRAADAEHARNVKAFRKVRLNDGQRAGVLTHPYVMARFAYASESSPIHRGVFLARGILGRTLRPPPNAFVPLAPDLHPDLTTRERVTLQTQSAECMACHGIINPLGFTLEQFDAIGRYRETERDKRVDATVAYNSPSGDEVKLDGARQLAEYLADSDDCRDAFIEQLFHHLVQQPVAAYGAETLAELRHSFAENHTNIRQLAAEIMMISALKSREIPDRNASQPTQTAEAAAMPQ